MKAVVLAAGEGTRLRPLTRARPKPMLPIANRPLLEHVLEAGIEAGIEEFVFVVGYKRERIQSYFGDGDDWGVDVEYAVQEKQLGTGHAVLRAESRVDGPFLVLNGDRIIEPSAISRVVEVHSEGEGPVLAVTRVGNPTDYGVVELEGHRVTGIREKPPAHAVTTDLINAGVYGFDEDVFEAIRGTETEGELGITTALEPYIDDGVVRAVRFSGLWLDVSHYWDLLSVNSRILDREGGEGETGAGTRTHDRATVAPSAAVGEDARIRAGAVVRRGVSLGDNVEVGPNAVVSNAVVLSDATIRDGAVVRDCVVGENADIGANTTVEGGPADVVVDGELHEEVRLGGVVGDNARVGGAVVVAAGTVLGNGARVESGATVDGRIEDDAVVRRG